MESAKAGAQKEIKSLLQGHFVDVKVADSADFAAWSKTFLSAVDESLREKAAAAAAASAAAAEAKATSNVDIETLEKQANHYKSILAETVC